LLAFHRRGSGGAIGSLAPLLESDREISGSTGLTLDKSSI
jgi:hypothetical protein